MAFRNDYDRDDDRWMFERNLRPRRSFVHEDDGPRPTLSDKLIDLVTVVVGIAGVIFLVDAIVTALG